MKSNVDMTDNSLFSNWRRAIGILINKSVIPWCWRQFHEQLGGSILTGNKHDREAGREIQFDLMVMKGNTIPFCYRCGEKIVPWKRCGELCKECADDINFYDRRIPWKHKIESVANSHDPIVLGLNFITDWRN